MTSTNNYRLPDKCRTSIEIGLNIVCRVARARTEPERRAMIWCVNYANLRGLNADQLAATLELDKRTIRAALTNPEEDLTRFMTAIAKERGMFEEGIRPLVETTPARIAREAVQFAARRPSIVECVGPSRSGKSVAVEHEYWLLLDRAIMIECPTGDSERELHESLAAALGISCNTGKKSHQVRVQIASCCSPDMISVVIVDEFHRVWPRNPKENLPKRLEYLRFLYRDGKGASIVGVGTLQFSANLLTAMKDNPRWSPDQWYGRRVPFYTPETMSERELEAIARYHAPDFEEELIVSLAQQALACDGFAGLIVNTIDLARDKADKLRSPKVTSEILTEAQAQMARGTLIEQIAQEQVNGQQPPARRPRRTLTSAPVARFNGAGHPPAAPVFTAPHTVRV